MFDVGCELLVVCCLLLVVACCCLPLPLPLPLLLLLFNTRQAGQSPQALQVTLADEESKIKYFYVTTLFIFSVSHGLLSHSHLALLRAKGHRVSGEDARSQSPPRGWASLADKWLVVKNGYPNGPGGQKNGKSHISNMGVF